MNIDPASDLRIALLPLDDRPVNVLLPQDVARVAGFTLDVPAVEILPKYRIPGDIDALAMWLMAKAADPAIDHLIVSLDMLCFGGLIGGRISNDTTTEVLARLDVLRRIRRSRPGLKISAVSLVMRASDSYSAAEEPDYWSDHGKELHQLGADIQRLDAQPDVTPLSETTTVPADVVSDFALRRLRNHFVNLTALRFVEDGTLDFLAVTADDTARFSAGSAEQAWIRHWMRFLPSGHKVLMYPGADEVGAVLVARAVADHAHLSVAVRISCPEPEGLGRIPSYENVPLAESIRRQITAAGAHLVDRAADVVLVVHAPDPDHRDMWNPVPPSPNQSAVDMTVDAVRLELAAGNSVALADVRYSNGCDITLSEKLIQFGVLDKLTSFGGWNTAGNTIGGVIATAVAATTGEAMKRRDPRAEQQALLTRVLDDFAYQSVIRREDGPGLFADHLPMSDDAKVSKAEADIRDRMNRMLAEDLPFDGWTVGRVFLPWRRSFEVGIELTDDVDRTDHTFGIQQSR